MARAAGVALVRVPGAATWLAGRRTTGDARSAFRAGSGMMFAVLITTLFVSATPAAAESLRSTAITGQSNGSAQADILYSSPNQSDALVQRLSGISGVHDATLIYTGLVQDGADPALLWIGDCSAIVRVERLPGVPCGRAPVVVAANARPLVGRPTQLLVDNTWPAAVQPLGARPDGTQNEPTSVLVSAVATMPAVSSVDTPSIIASPQALNVPVTQLRPTLLAFRYDTPAALEQARTTVVTEVAAASVATRQTTYDGFSGDLRRFYRVLLLASLLVFGAAGCATALSLTAGLLDRRRLFVLLRNAGTSAATLRRSLFLEAMAPLVATSVVAAGVGAAMGRWIVAGRSSPQQANVAALCAPTAAGLLIAAAIAGLTLFGVGPATRSTHVRDE